MIRRVCKEFELTEITRFSSVILKNQPIIYHQRIPYPVEVPVPIPYAEPIPYPVEVLVNSKNHGKLRSKSRDFLNEFDPDRKASSHRTRKPKKYGKLQSEDRSKEKSFESFSKKDQTHQFNGVVLSY